MLEHVDTQVYKYSRLTGIFLDCVSVSAHPSPRPSLQLRGGECYDEDDAPHAGAVMAALQRVQLPLSIVQTMSTYSSTLSPLMNDLVKYIIHYHFAACLTKRCSHILRNDTLKNKQIWGNETGSMLVLILTYSPPPPPNSTCLLRLALPAAPTGRAGENAPRPRGGEKHLDKLRVHCDTHLKLLQADLPV